MRTSVYVLLFGLLVFSSCKTKQLVYQSIQNFSVEQTPKPSMTLDIRLYNPNRYNLKLKNSDVDVFLNGQNLGKLHLEGYHLAPKRDTFLLPVALEVNSQAILPVILLTVMQGDVKIKLTGTIRGGRHGIYIKVPVDYEGTENLMSSMK